MLDSIDSFRYRSLHRTRIATRRCYSDASLWNLEDLRISLADATESIGATLHLTTASPSSRSSGVNTVSTVVDSILRLASMARETQPIALNMLEHLGCRRADGKRRATTGDYKYSVIHRRCRTTRRGEALIRFMLTHHVVSDTVNNRNVVVGLFVLIG